jgi:hypothetical protein
MHALLQEFHVRKHRLPIGRVTTAVLAGTTTAQMPGDRALVADSKFSAPSASAARGRRNAPSSKIVEAANLTAFGNYQGAIGDLTSLLLRLDDDPTPPDWMLPSSERDQLAIDIDNLISWLQYEL